MADRIVDAWIQHPTLRHSNHEMFDPLRRWTGAAHYETPLPLEFTLAALDVAGVDVALTSAWYGPEGPLISNDEVAGFCAEASGRLVGVAGADIRQPVAAVRELRRAVTDLGFVALRLLPWLWEVPPTDRRFYPLLAACAELGVRSAPRSATPGRFGPPRPVVPSPTSTRSPSTSPTW